MQKQLSNSCHGINAYPSKLLRNGTFKFAKKIVVSSYRESNIDDKERDLGN